jgi:hypothetical protein
MDVVQAVQDLWGSLVVDKWLIPSDSQVSLTIIYQVSGQKIELFLKYGILFPKLG